MVWVWVWALGWVWVLVSVWALALVSVEPMARRCLHLADDVSERCRLPAGHHHQPHPYLPFRACNCPYR